ncbi:hypothetical protein H7J50_03670 [Mycobacterium intermedium]|nr:hypothetical protein [Mycobacterium intermedium]MCV6962909.1 hypothetical protein [Mycobacterium intermedium]
MTFTPRYGRLSDTAGLDPAVSDVAVSYAVVSDTTALVIGKAVQAGLA